MFKIILIFSIIFIIIIYIKSKYYKTNIERFDNDILCNNDCKCMYNDNNKIICGRKDNILGILECEGCDDNLYKDLCSDCTKSIKSDTNIISKQKCNNCMLDKTSCHKCTNCVWCNDTNSCIQGDVIGPSEGLKCGNWEYYNKKDIDLYKLTLSQINFYYERALKRKVNWSLEI